MVADHAELPSAALTTVRSTQLRSRYAVINLIMTSGELKTSLHKNNFDEILHPSIGLSGFSEAIGHRIATENV